MYAAVILLPTAEWVRTDSETKALYLPLDIGFELTGIESIRQRFWAVLTALHRLLCREASTVLVVFVDECQRLLNNDDKCRNVLFRALRQVPRMWRLESNVVLAFAATTAKLTNFYLFNDEDEGDSRNPSVFSNPFAISFRSPSMPPFVSIVTAYGGVASVDIKVRGSLLRSGETCIRARYGMAEEMNWCPG